MTFSVRLKTISIGVLLTSGILLSACSTKYPPKDCFAIGEIEIDVRGSAREYKLAELGGFRPGDRVAVVNNRLVRC